MKVKFIHAIVGVTDGTGRGPFLLVGGVVHVRAGGVQLGRAMYNRV